MNVTIGEKRTFDDWGLKLQSLVIGLPEVKTNPVDIPGADGAIDLTEALGKVRYQNRPIEMIFDSIGTLEQWHAITSQIANYMHGQRKKVIFDSDPGYYYLGRLKLNSEKSNFLMNRIVVSGDMDPYKYELYSSMEDWLWDSFSFEDGIIREYKNLKVYGSLEVVIPGTRKEVIPTLTASTDMQVEWQGKRYDLPTGESKIYSVSLSEGDNVLTFYGTGTISIDYRGGIL